MKPAREKIKELEVMVAEVIPETADTTTLVLFTGNDSLNYEPGHFLTIEPHQFEGLQRWVRYLEDVKGKKEAPRAYSLSSSPDEKYLALTIKGERYISGVTPYPPLLSPILAKRTLPGVRMIVTGFTGPYILKPNIKAAHDNLVHICAGSGVVPSYSIIKHNLRTNDLKHTLIYSNKVYEDIIFLKQLDELEREFPHKLRVIYTLTRGVNASLFGPRIRPGRVSKALLEEVCPEISNSAVFLCGPDHNSWQKIAAREKGETLPPSFMGSMLSYLKERGVPKNQITKESYG